MKRLVNKIENKSVDDILASDEYYNLYLEVIGKQDSEENKEKFAKIMTIVSVLETNKIRKDK